jgi:hypothetical protein
MDIELTLSQSIHKQFLDGVSDHENEVLDIEDMKIKDRFDIFMSNRHVLQNCNSFRNFSGGSLEGFIGMNQWLVSQKVERAFTGDDIGSNGGAIEDVYQGSSYGAGNG